MKNADQINNWNERSGPRWVAMQRLLDGQLEPFGRAALARLPIRAGQRVLDIGCGCGASTFELAELVGDGGHVTGVDVSAVMLHRARERAAGRANVDFVEADAQTHDFAERYDALYSRFGVMFFDDPVTAFRRLHAALVADAPMSFVAWRPAHLNPWMTVPLAAAVPLLETPPAPPLPNAPGPFGFADDVRVCGLLAEAGFRGVKAEALDVAMLLAGGGGVEEALEVSLQVGPCGQIVRENPHLTDKVREAVREALGAYVTDAGVSLPAAVWVYTARA
jgi:SAM-dependent methyltransferase